ncbi:MAG: sulfatase [Isosphaeraceae bacterium]
MNPPLSVRARTAVWPWISLVCLATASPAARAAERLNVVWIIGEDMGPELGCYGDKNAVTPNMDRLAREGARFTRAFTHAPVCAPCRSGLITGQYPTKIGSHHMRSTLLKPPPMFTSYLRDAGYLVCWPTKSPFGKTDFNFALPPNSFDVVTDWTQDVPRDRPFFGFFNITTSHESQIRAAAPALARNLARVTAEERHDPDTMRVPAYHPDTPIVRRDLANYYDLVTAVDHKIGDVLDALDRAGVADRTVVILTGDHGRGLPRSKRWVYDSGTHVPLLIRWPGVIPPGSVRDDLVCFLDLPATTLALAGVPVPGAFDGRVIVGPKTEPASEYVFAARDRMDERDDRIRGVRGARFHYVRNFRPELPYAQRIAYMEEMPTMREWRRLHAEAKLNPVQDAFFAPTKPVEELYDTEADPDEVHNLADDPRYRATLEAMRVALDDWIEETNDLGEFSERSLIRRGLVADRLTEYEVRKTEVRPAR